MRQSWINPRNDTNYQRAIARTSDALDNTLRAMHHLHKIEIAEHCEFEIVEQLLDNASASLREARQIIHETRVAPF